MTQWHELDGLAQGELIRTGELSPRELVGHYLDRIAAHDEALGAFVTVTAEAARAQAALPRPVNAGPLWGVPTAIKDNIVTAGVRTTFGSKAFEDFVPEVDAHLVTLVKRAGMISLGKTNTPEFSLSIYSDNDVSRSSRNPWDTGTTAGGSSGGAAAAVAAGLVPVAHANDGAGSVRIPAGICGVFGLKASRGRVSPGPLGVDLFGLTVQGTIARTVADAAAMLDVMAGPMPGDPHWAPPLPAGETFLAATKREPGRMRIACYVETGLDWIGIHPQVRLAYERTITMLTDLGHEVEEIKNPFPPELDGIFTTLWATQSLRFRVPVEKQGLLRPVTKWWQEQGRTMAGGQLIDALADGQLIARRVVADLDTFDAILTPTAAMPPVAPEWFSEDGDLEQEIRRQTAYSPYAGCFNLTGQPAANLPLYWTPDGLPIGSMVVGRPAGEAQLLSLCAQLEQASPWSDRWPSLEVGHGADKASRLEPTP